MKLRSPVTKVRVGTSGFRMWWFVIAVLCLGPYGFAHAQQDGYELGNSLWWIIPGAAVLLVTAYIVGRRIGKAYARADQHANLRAQSALKPAIVTAILTWSRATLAKLATLNSHPVVNYLADLWWIRVPLWPARRISKPVGLLLLDGVYLSAWPAVAAAAPPLALLMGLLLGSVHFAPGDSFTWSMPVMVLMLGVSSFGAALGAWLWLGYAVGDFFLFTHPVSAFNHTLLDEILHVRVPLFQTYILLAVLLVLFPLLNLRLQRQVTARWKLPRAGRSTVAVVLAAFLPGLLVYIWAHAVPILSGPLYTWSQYGKYSRAGYAGPPIEAMQPLRTMGWILVVVAAVLGGVRIVLQSSAAQRLGVLQRLIFLRKELSKVQQPRALNIPSWMAVLSTTGFFTWMLSGLLDNLREAIILAAALAFMIHAYKNLLPRMTAYVHVISRVPLEMRIIAALAITTLIALAIVGVMWSGPYSDTFLPNLIGTIFGLAVFAVLLPRVESPPGSKAAANTGQANTQEGAGGRGR